MARLAAAALGLWGALLLLHFQAVALWSWGPAQPLVDALYRTAEVLALPFGVLAALIIPQEGHHYSTAHMLLRTGLAAVSLPALLAIVRAARGRPPAGGALTRRALLLAVPAAAAGAWVVVVEPNRLQVRRYEVSIENLPPGLDGFRLGHVSDTHHGPYVTAEFIERALRMLEEESPDLLVFTGDYVHRTAAALPRGIEVLADGRARLGRVAVLGNHDHWEGVEASRAEIRARGIPLLDNGRLFLTRDGVHREPVPEALALCGVGDLWEGQVLPEEALQGVPDAMPRVLLSHNPDVAEQIQERFDLQLSGHTHGGQVWVPGLGTPVVPSRYGQKYAGGLVQGPGWPVIVSRGVGMAVMPVRFGVPPEVGLVVLRRA